MRKNGIEGCRGEQKDSFPLTNFLKKVTKKTKLFWKIIVSPKSQTLT